MANLIGNKYGRLTVLEDSGDRCWGGIMWNCQCECGNTINVVGKSLKNGSTTSCGCYRRDLMTIHGESRTRLYEVWENMIDRTTNPNNNKYQNYGGRGISVCDEWKEYINFSNWAKENGYNDSLTIDRIDVNGKYEPSNCRWATQQVQANNRTNNYYITWNDKTQSLKDWSRELNLTYDTLRSRLKRGWSVEKAFTTPKMNYK